MLMRCEPLKGSLSAEESVEPIPGQAEFLSDPLRLCTRKANPELSDNCPCKGDTPWLGWCETQAGDLASPGEAVFMPTPAECPAAVSGPSSKTLQLLRKRLRQLGRVLLVVTIGLAVAAGALAIWWLNSLNGLPDIGDPFDVAEFRAFRIPDEQNAFTLVRRANQK